MVCEKLEQEVLDEYKVEEDQRSTYTGRRNLQAWTIKTKEKDI